MVKSVQTQGNMIITIDDVEQKRKIKFSTFKKIAPFFKEHQLSISLSILGVLVSTGLGALLPLIFRELVDKAIPAKNNDLIFQIALIYLCILFLSVAVEFIQQLIVGFMGIEIVSNIKKKMLSHIFTLGIPFFDKYNTGKLISRIESDCEQLFMLFSSIGLQVLWAVLNILISFVVMFSINPKFAWLTTSIIPVFTLGSLLIFKKMRPMFRKERDIYAEITGFLSEYIKGIPTLRGLCNINWGIEKFKKINEQRWKYSAKIHAIRSAIWFFLMLTPNLIIAYILYESVGWVKQEAITIGTVWLFIQYISNSIQPLVMISEQIGEIQRSFGAADKIFDILDTPSEEGKLAKYETLSAFCKNIEFQNVSFHYKEGESVLKNISFEIKKGETIALVGPTGCGKTTLLSLLTRFYEPIEGRILIDGKDIKHLKKENLRSFMGLVLQDIYLFPGNALDNIRVFREDIEPARVIQSARDVMAYDFISKMPNQFYSDLAEDGGNLSFGERQLLSFARALCFSPELLILDEATSSIDPYTEMLIQKSLEQLRKNRTCIMVAHRLSTIAKADKIIVLKDGVIKEMGTHEELLNAKGVYSGFYYKQLGEQHNLSFKPEGELC